MQIKYFSFKEQQTTKAVTPYQPLFSHLPDNAGCASARERLLLLRKYEKILPLICHKLRANNNLMRSRGKKQIKEIPLKIHVTKLAFDVVKVRALVFMFYLNSIYLSN